MEGILPIYKKSGVTSFDVIRRLKKLLPHGQKIGHGGTLDPFAEGVLLILLGKATKRFDEIKGWKKRYLAVARLGARSNTLDSEGKISKTIKKHLINNLSVEEIQKKADEFVGEIEQVVPQYSAAKYKGKPLYKYARRGEKVPQKIKKVMIDKIKVLNIYCSSVSEHGGKVKMEVICGSGTYIRQLSYDIFSNLGIESYLEKLTRLQVGEITTHSCVKLEEILDKEGLLEKHILDG